MVSARPVFKVQDRDRDWAGTVSKSETETRIHDYLRLRPERCVFLRPGPEKWSRPRVSLISGWDDPRSIPFGILGYFLLTPCSAH